jgi:hypothetical protein
MFIECPENPLGGSTQNVVQPNSSSVMATLYLRAWMNFYPHFTNNWADLGKVKIARKCRCLTGKVKVKQSH